MQVTYVSVTREYAADVAGAEFFAVRDANRWSRWSFAVLAWQLLRVCWRVRPDIIVTTGAAPGLIALIIGKYLFRARTLWIDSIANCQRLSGSGRMALRLADVCLTQWPSIEKDGRPAYWGAVL